MRSEKTSKASILRGIVQLLILNAVETAYRMRAERSPQGLYNREAIDVGGIEEQVSVQCPGQGRDSRRLLNI